MITDPLQRELNIQVHLFVGNSAASGHSHTRVRHPVLTHPSVKLPPEANPSSNPHFSNINTDTLMWKILHGLCLVCFFFFSHQNTNNKPIYTLSKVVTQAFSDHSSLSGQHTPAPLTPETDTHTRQAAELEFSISMLREGSHPLFGGVNPK